MNSFDRYAPPKAAATERDDDPPGVPLMFSILLGAFLLFGLFWSYVGYNIEGLVWTTLNAFAGWHAVKGKRFALRASALLLTISLLIMCLASWVMWSDGPVARSATIVVTLDLFALLGLVFFNSRMRRILRKGGERRERGG